MGKIEFRRGTSSQWTSSNPVLSSAEPGWDEDLKSLKIGDGTTPWASLPSISVPAPPPPASTTDQGVVELADSSESIAGVAADLATTPSGVAAAVLDVLINKFRVLPRVRWTGSAWESRAAIIPTGYTGVVVFDSSTDPAATVPPFTHAGDEWEMHPDSPYTPWA